MGKFLNTFRGGLIFRGYTSWAAYASFDEQRKGTLAPGMLADTATVFDGRVVYTRP